MANSITAQNLPSIKHNDIPVITTELLAQLYGTDAINIQVNFSRNAERFIVGKHYFKLEGEPLRNFKHGLTQSKSVKIARNVRSFILWTERGAARHAKMLETDQAWEVFEALEDSYFTSTHTKIAPPPPAEPQPKKRLYEIDFIDPTNELILSFDRSEITQLNAMFHVVEWLTDEYWPRLMALFPSLKGNFESEFIMMRTTMSLLKSRREECLHLTELIMQHRS